MTSSQYDAYIQESIRVGIVGGGATSAVGKAHVSALSLIPSVRIEASVPSSVNVEERGQSLLPPQTRLHASLEDFIFRERGKLDWVVLLTPTPLHYEHSMALLAAGFNTISEKAVSQSAAEMSEIFETALFYGAELHGIQNYAGFPALAGLGMLARGGKIGKFLHVKSEMLQQGYLREVSGNVPRPQSWRLNDQPLPMILLDLGVHAIHLGLTVTGEKPNLVTMVKSYESPSLGVCTSAIILGKSDHGVTFEFNVSKGRFGKSNSLSIEIFGEEGSLSWNLQNADMIHFCGKDGLVTALDRQHLEEQFPELIGYSRFKSGHPVGFVEALANYYQSILFAPPALEQRPISPASREELLGTLNILEAADKSSHTLRWEAVRF